MPGGDIQRRSGTSMASPQVVNLAAKLLAVHPGLSTVTLRRLIIDGADTKDVSRGRSIRLLNEARSFQLSASEDFSPPTSLRMTADGTPNQQNIDHV